MQEALKRSRVLRLIVCAFMVPLIVMTSSNTARAAEALASNVITIETEVNFTGAWATISNPECLVQVDALEGALRVHTGYCEVGVTPDFGCEILEPDCTTMTVEYRGAGGCLLSQPVYTDRFQDGWFTNRVYIQSPARQVGTCQVQEVCMVIRADLPQWPDATFTGCEPLGMDVPVEVPSGECPHGLVTLRDISDPIDLPGGSGYSPRQMVRDVTFDVESDVGGWRAYALVRDHAGGYRYWDATNSAYDQTKTPAEAIRLSWSQMDGVQDTLTVRVNTADEHDYNAPSPPESRDIIGVGVFRNTNGYDHHGVPNFGSYPLGLERLGVTDPAVCAFYWGDEVWDDGDPDGGLDEPLGPLPEDYVPDVDITLPDDLDVVTGPDSEGGFWGAVVDVLGRLLKAVKDVAGAIGGLVRGIVDGLTGAFKALFIPDEFPDWSGVSVDLPSGWVPELPELGSGACGPMVVPEMDFGMAGDVGGYPFVDTCEAPWTHVRTVTYFGLMALALIVVAKRIFNAALGGVGMSVEGGSGGGDDL